LFQSFTNYISICKKINADFTDFYPTYKDSLSHLNKLIFGKEIEATFEDTVDAYKALLLCNPLKNVKFFYTLLELESKQSRKENKIKILGVLRDV